MVDHGQESQCNRLWPDFSFLNAIIAIDGQSVSDFDDLNRYLVFYTQPGQTVQMTVLRDGDTIVLPLELGVRP